MGPEGGQTTFCTCPGRPRAGGCLWPSGEEPPSPKPLPRPCQPHPWLINGGAGRHIHASATPFSCAKSQPAGSVLRSGKAPGNRSASRTRPQRGWEKTGSGWDQARAAPPLLLPSAPTQPHVTRGPQHAGCATLGASASHHGPGISTLPSAPKVGLGPQRHLSCLKAAASKLARMPQAGIMVWQPVQGVGTCV